MPKKGFRSISYRSPGSAAPRCGRLPEECQRGFLIGIDFPDLVSGSHDELVADGTGAQGKSIIFCRSSSQSFSRIPERLLTKVSGALDCSAGTAS